MESKPPVLDIVTACRLKDLGTLRLALPRLRLFLPHKRLVVFTAKTNTRLFMQKLGSGIECINEDEVFSDMKLKDLQSKITLPGFPQGAGWYFQQFLKLSYPKIRPEVDRYLIWDADTVPLRAFDVFGTDGKALVTPATMAAAQPPRGVPMDSSTAQRMQEATRPHPSYFENFNYLLGETIKPSRSFIAQHMPIHVPTLRALIEKVETRFVGSESWPWKVIKNLKGNNSNLFSEYEFYAHFALLHSPAFHKIRPLSWSRAGHLSCWRSSEAQFREWGAHLDYVALERWSSPLRRGLVRGFNLLPHGIRKKIQRQR
jgi:hypothetical protein